MQQDSTKEDIIMAEIRNINTGDFTNFGRAGKVV